MAGTPLTLAVGAVAFHTIFPAVSIVAFCTGFVSVLGSIGYSAGLYVAGRAQGRVEQILANSSRTALPEVMGFYQDHEFSHLTRAGHNVQRELVSEIRAAVPRDISESVARMQNTLFANAPNASGSDHPQDPDSVVAQIGYDRIDGPVLPDNFSSSPGARSGNPQDPDSNASGFGSECGDSRSLPGNSSNAVGVHSGANVSNRNPLPDNSLPNARGVHSGNPRLEESLGGSAVEEDSVSASRVADMRNPMQAERNPLPDNLPNAFGNDNPQDPDSVVAQIGSDQSVRLEVGVGETGAQRGDGPPMPGNSPRVFGLRNDDSPARRSSPSRCSPQALGIGSTPSTPEDRGGPSRCTPQPFKIGSPSTAKTICGSGIGSSSTTAYSDSPLSQSRGFSDSERAVPRIWFDLSTFGQSSPSVLSVCTTPHANSSDETSPKIEADIPIPIFKLYGQGSPDVLSEDDCSMDEHPDAPRGVAVEERSEAKISLGKSASAPEISIRSSALSKSNGKTKTGAKESAKVNVAGAKRHLTVNTYPEFRDSCKSSKPVWKP